MKTSEFQYLNPYLESVYFKVNDDFVSNDNEVEMQNRFAVNVKRKENVKRAKVQLKLEINADLQNKPFELIISVASDFRWEGDIDDRTVDMMLNSNAPAFLLSYMRPIVANITNSSNIPVYNLPFINFKK